MSKTPTLPAITSTFALLDVQKGRAPLAKVVGAGYKIPVTMTGYIQNGAGGVGGDDGVSREFSVDIESVVMGEPIFVPADKIGRAWALVSDLDVGDKVQVDADFSCIPANKTRRTVRADEHGLFLACRGGRHYLESQIGKHGEYVGVYKLG